MSMAWCDWPAWTSCGNNSNNNSNSNSNNNNNDGDDDDDDGDDDDNNTECMAFVAFLEESSGPLSLCRPSPMSSTSMPILSAMSTLASPSPRL